MPKDPLEQLRAQLENEDITPERQAQMDQLKASVQRGVDDPDHHPSLLEELEEALILFGDDHPNLRAAIRAAVDTLSTGGV